jgi:hypothetical protein
MTQQPREVTLQELLNHGLNGFAVLLLIESIERHPGKPLLKPLRFQFRGFKFTIEPHPELVDQNATPAAEPELERLRRLPGGP